MKAQYGTGGFLQMSAKNVTGNDKLTDLFGKDAPVSEPVADNLIQTYATRYEKPSDDSEAIAQLGDIFNDLMGYVSDDVREGIGEYYRILSNRSLPAFEWILEAMHVASKKGDQKRNFPYVVGMIRRWMKYGFGYIPSQEEEEVVDYFEEVTGMEVTTKARTVIQHLMGTYGAIKVTRMIGSLSKDRDYYMACILKQLLEEKYSDTTS